MRKQAIIALVVAGGLAIAMLTPVQAVETPSESPTLNCDVDAVEVDIDTAANLYNNNTDAVPPVISSAVNTNTSELQIRGADQEYYTARTDGLNLTSVELGQAEEPDVVLVTDRETACSLYFSDEPVSDFQQAYIDDEIEIEAKGTANSAAVFVIEKVTDGIDYLDKTLGELF